MKNMISLGSGYKERFVVPGTTPTLRFRFKTIPLDQLARAYLTILQDEENIIEKSIEDAEMEENYLSFTLTQQETLKIKADGCLLIQLRFKTLGGYAGASPAYLEKGYRILKGGEI